jgi:glutamate carboxypeptidase
MPISREERAILDRLPASSALSGRLRELVDLPSPTRFKEGVDRVGNVCEAALEAAGFRVAVMVNGSCGRHLIARRAGEGRRLLLIGHLDTVHDERGAFRGLSVSEDGLRGVGPGAADMKGGVVVMLAALLALHDAGRLDGRSVTVVLNADEEVGSPDSTDLIRSEAEESQLALAFEHGNPVADGGATTIVTARRGIGRMVVAASGVAAHAGSETERGASALVELCHKAVLVTELSDDARRRSVNVGTLHGGTAANVVAEHAEMTVDYRFPDKESGEDMTAAITEIVSEPRIRNAAGRPLVRTVCREHVIRPPLVRTDAVAAAAARIIAAGADLGQAIIEESRGGSSDAALAFDAGCPAVCGLGVIGGAIHTDREWMLMTSLRDRAALTAIVADRFFSQ